MIFLLDINRKSVTTNTKINKIADSRSIILSYPTISADIFNSINYLLNYFTELFCESYNLSLINFFLLLIGKSSEKMSSEISKVAEKIDNIKNVITGSIEEILEISDPNKYYQNMSDELDKAENNDETDVYFGTLTQDLTDLDISAEFAGIVFFVSSLTKIQLFDPERAMQLLRLYYEYDTGKMLNVSQIQSLIMNKKTEMYANKISENIKKNYERTKLADLNNSSGKADEVAPRG